MTSHGSQITDKFAVCSNLCGFYANMKQGPAGTSRRAPQVSVTDDLRSVFKLSFVITSDKTRTTRTPAFWGYPSPPNDYPYHWVILDPKSKEDKVKFTNLRNLPKFKSFEFWNKYYKQHTFWSCLTRCANMKWIRRVFWIYRAGTILSTDGHTDNVKPV